MKDLFQLPKTPEQIALENVQRLVKEWKTPERKMLSHSIYPVFIDGQFTGKTRTVKY